ncbi:MAG: murein L,D-transpeptidase catalytic domain-containing protein, partial [Cetobacterium sp.]
MVKNVIFILLTLASSTMASMGSYSINEKLNLDSALSIDNIKVKNGNSFQFSPNNSIENLYNELNLRNKIEFTTFSNAVSGMKKIKGVKEDIITIVDFTKPSVKERFFVIDLKNKKTLFSTYVMHGKNSGESIPKEFSNVVNSFKSSPGFYKTENTYSGEFGYSLRLDGLEKGIN